ncbi:hypothetical protein [Streptomyces sioyaensis]|uniref:hypothetical protein n=1 Tax=Streptomyces sioyaensis TaxID=67364 RepID=UPI0036E1A310
MPSVVGLLEERERAALTRVEELRAELERLRDAVAEAEEAARRAAVAREEVAEVLAASPVTADFEVLGTASAVVPKGEVPFWQPGLDRAVLAADCAAIVALVEEDAAAGGEGVRARRMRDRLGWQASDAREQAARFRAKRSHAVLARTASPWLFPGGQPGRPISAWAMGERLRKLGIRLAETRSTALFQLATELPAAILARTLGIHITVAVKWQRAAAGDWGAYAAEISRRNSS